MEEKLVINKLKGFDTNTFEYIINSYEKKVYRFIYNMIHDEFMAQDLTQEVFIKIYKNFYKYNKEYPFEAWMFKIAYYTTLNYLKKNKKNELQFNEEFNNKETSEDYINNFELRDTILQELQSFTPECRAIYILRLFDDLSFEQIAQMLGITTAAAKLKFYRNRKVLIKKLNREV